MSGRDDSAPGAGDQERAQQDRLRLAYEAQSSKLFVLALRLLGNRADAEDALQEAMVRAWRSIGGFRGDAALSSWLYRIVVNVCRDIGKKRGRTLPEPEATEATSDAPDDALLRERVQRALATLPQGYREMVVLHDVLERSHADIAEIRGTSLGTCKSQLHKAHALLKKRLRIELRARRRSAEGES